MEREVDPNAVNGGKIRRTKGELYLKLLQKKKRKKKKTKADKRSKGKVANKTNKAK